MSGVKRFEAHYLTDGVMGGKALARAEMVLASDYDRLEQELKRLKADRSACWAEFKVMTRSCLDAEKERNEARAERDALRAQVEVMRDALLSLLTLDVKGHHLLERLQFSTKGREILEKVNAAMQAKP